MVWGRREKRGFRIYFPASSEIPANVWKRADGSGSLMPERAALQAAGFMISQRKGSYADCSCSGKMLEGSGLRAGELMVSEEKTLLFCIRTKNRFKCFHSCLKIRSWKTRRVLLTCHKIIDYLTLNHTTFKEVTIFHFKGRC